MDPIEEGGYYHWVGLDGPVRTGDEYINGIVFFSILLVILIAPVVLVNIYHKRREKQISNVYKSR